MRHLNSQQTIETLEEFESMIALDDVTSSRDVACACLTTLDAIDCSGSAVAVNEFALKLWSEIEQDSVASSYADTMLICLENGIGDYYLDGWNCDGMTLSQFVESELIENYSINPCLVAVEHYSIGYQLDNTD